MVVRLCIKRPVKRPVRVASPGCFHCLLCNQLASYVRVHLLTGEMVAIALN